MKKYKPNEMMPDETTDVLAYYGKKTGYVVVGYFDGEWLEAWGGSYIDEPEHWIDLNDIDAEATD